jgi:hypothetical protein
LYNKINKIANIKNQKNAKYGFSKIKNRKSKIKNHKFKYSQNNILKILIAASRSRDREKHRDFNIEEDYIKFLIDKQDNKCYYCNNDLELINKVKKLSQISIDRVDSNFGHVKDNCVITCLFCNYAKNKTKVEYFLDFMNVLKDFSLYEDIKNKYIDTKLQTNLYYNNKICAERADKKKSNYEPSNLISVKDIKQLYIKQNGCCAITGIPFLNLKLDMFPFKMSLDRINNDGLHTIDNCQLVCMAIQYGRNNKSMEIITDYIETIRNIFSIEEYRIHSC